MGMTERGQSNLRGTHDVNGLEFNLNIAADERRRRRDLNITSHLYLHIAHISGAGHVPTYSATGLPVPYTAGRVAWLF